MRLQVYILSTLLLTIFSCKREHPDIKPQVTEPVAYKQILILTETKGYRHASIDDGVSMFNKHSDAWGIKVTHASESNVLLSDTLEAYSMIVLLSTTGDFLSDNEQVALDEYMLSGGSILGIHAATDAEYDNSGYRIMLGAQFDSHPAIQEARCIVKANIHSIADGLPYEWYRTDEWYNFKNIEVDNEVWLELDEQSYDGGKHGRHHPISWFRKYKNGRVFYTGMGHTQESYTDPLFIKHIENAVKALLQE